MSEDLLILLEERVRGGELYLDQAGEVVSGVHVRACGSDLVPDYDVEGRFRT